MAPRARERARTSERGLERGRPESPSEDSQTSRARPEGARNPGHRPGVVELFAGAGGAALGLRRAGFAHIVAVERDPRAAATLRAAGFHVEEKLVEDFRYKGPRPTLLWASPPCVAWSSAGKRAGACDPRALWPATLAQIRAIKPVWVVVENVVGAPVEDWAKELAEFGYKTIWILNAKDFCVPQDRARKFLVAGPAPVEAPKPTGCRVASDAVPGLRGKWLRTEMITARARSADTGPAPTIVTKSILYVYPTDVGVRVVHKLGPGGRIGTVEEVALLQGFPSDWPFQGSKADQWKQVGNAVPPALAEVIGKAILRAAGVARNKPSRPASVPLPARERARPEVAVDFERARSESPSEDSQGSRARRRRETPSVSSGERDLAPWEAARLVLRTSR